MNAYLTNIAVLIFYGLLAQMMGASRPDPASRAKTTSAVFCLLASLNWIMLAGFRDLTVGADTLAYFDLFERTKSETYTELVSRVVDFFLLKPGEKDPGYYLLVKIIQSAGVDYRLFMFMVAASFMIPFALFVYRHSPSPLFSFLIYSVLFYAFFSITGYRQTIATALAVLIGYRFILSRRIVPFITIVLIASTIHKSALIFLPMYFLWTWSVDRRSTMVALITMLAVFIFRTDIFNFYRSFAGYETYVPEQAGGVWTYVVVLICLGGATLWRIELVDPEDRAFFQPLLVSLCLLPLVLVNPIITRVIQYFLLFLVIQAPVLAATFPRKDRPLVYASLTVLLLILFVASGAGGTYQFL